MSRRTWTEEELKTAVSECLSLRKVLARLGLVEAGGNYAQIKKYIKSLGIDTSHFRGKGWSKGLKLIRHPKISLEEILVKNSSYQSHKLKNRLFQAGLKRAQCEECGWEKISEDGRLPLELDHINGDRNDNTLENLRILCPNCHSLKPTHRGRNMGQWRNW